MYLQHLIIKNFRAIESIDAELGPHLNLIVGPNAIGKTTILDAIRMVKSLVAARTPNEANAVLTGMGASNQYNPQQIINDAVAGDPSIPLDIQTIYRISDAEAAILQSSVDQLARNLAVSRLGPHQNPASILGYMSSPIGQLSLNSAREEVVAGLSNLNKANPTVNLNVQIDFVRGQLSRSDPIAGVFFSFLEMSQPPYLTKFSYFPADRAMPRGEQPVQLGWQDANQTLESHTSNPELKYARLKNSIFNAVIQNESARREVFDQFALIFRSVLKGRELVESQFGLNQHGQLSIYVRDIASGRTFDIDRMSSGEKGLLLTFLLLNRTLCDEAVVLLDEPELHLNPAVCRDLVDLMIDHYILPKKLQIIACTHSPEIVAGALNREDRTRLFHLESSRKLGKVRVQDEDEIIEALRRLGTTESESMLYVATVFVEGESDKELLEIGFGSLLRRINIKSLGGRAEVERNISTLQAKEAASKIFSPTYFLFDLDGMPTGLKGSNLVRFAQWRRHCVENYLLEFDVICDILADPDVSKRVDRSFDEIRQTFKQAALGQLDLVVARTVYQRQQFEPPSVRATDLDGLSLGEITAKLSAQALRSKESLMGFEPDRWSGEFIEQCAAERSKIARDWEEQWPKICHGKRLFADVRKDLHLRIPAPTFKRRIMKEMRLANSPNWLEMNEIIKNLVRDI